ncbi:hypothetical protein F5Y19DRAFT_480750 [Xylariaceae sp. FL1651]|nr:hypothetical protein F5Y19DRAFT_480750 [Xylariaceae sp. FL1651]
MDGDYAYHLMSTYVPPELIHRRHRQPPRREQAKTPKSTSTVAASSTTSTTSTLSSPHVSPANNKTATTIPTNINTNDIVDDNTGFVTTTADYTGDHLDGHGGHPLKRNLSPEGTTTSRRSSFGEHGTRLFGRSVQRRAASLTKSPPLRPSPHVGRTPSDASSNSHPSYQSHEQQPTLALPLRSFNKPQSDGAVSGGTAESSPVTFNTSVASAGSSSSKSVNSTSAGVAPAVPSLATQLTPAFASPPSESPESPKYLHLFSRHNSNTPPHQNPTPLKRLHRRDPFHRRPSHDHTQLSPTLGPLTEPVEGLHNHHDSMSNYYIPHTPPHHTQYRTPNGMPPPGSSALANQSGVMASNDNLPSSSAERSGTLSTASNATSMGSKPQLLGSKAFVVRNNRTYINDSTLPYPLPVDLAEIHRQTLRTLLMFQLFGGPILSTAFASKPPARVLDVGCGSGFWSMMCHRYFAQHGHSAISFTGLDIVPLGGSGTDSNAKPDKDMKWRFVQHDMRQTPWPFADGEFDLVMVKDMSYCSPQREAQTVMEEYLRVLKPGGVLESWETDSKIRMLRPHAPKNAPSVSHDDDSSSDSSGEEDSVERMGAYVMTTNTPMSAPLNPFLVEYNGWLTKAFEGRGLSPVPCTVVGAYLLQEAESLMDVQSKRLAIPLSEIRWEREGVGGIVTKDGKSYIDSQKGKFKDAGGKGGKALTTAQAALRRTALETTVSLILAFEPLLRDVTGKSQEEWDTWAGKMANDLLREGGTSWGECLEVGVWTSRKRHSQA